MYALPYLRRLYRAATEVPRRRYIRSAYPLFLHTKSVWLLSVAAKFIAAWKSPSLAAPEKRERTPPQEASPLPLDVYTYIRVYIHHSSASLPCRCTCISRASSTRGACRHDCGGEDGSRSPGDLPSPKNPTAMRSSPPSLKAYPAPAA